MTRIPPLLLAAALGIGLAAHPAAAFDTEARAAMVVDMTSGAVLLSKNVDEQIPPASMSKLMTLDLVFEALKDGRLSLDDELPVSTRAWSMGGSRMFVREGSRVKVSDLLRGVIVQSGNDACVVLAEGLAGSEEAFAERMTQRAHELGMKDAHFTNATGWPDPEHHMSVRDLMILAERMVNEFPEFYPIFSETEFEWDGVDQKNRNPLLYLDLQADGLKTGHTEDAGYGLVASALRDGRRVALVVAGLPSMKARAQESERLLTWAYREFRTGKVVTAGEIVGVADVWVGAEKTVPLTPARDVVATVPYASADEMTATIRYDGPIPAPIVKGQVVATLEIAAPGVEPVSVPLAAAVDVPKGGVLTRAFAAIDVLTRGGDGAGQDAPAATN